MVCCPSVAANVAHSNANPFSTAEEELLMVAIVERGQRPLLSCSFGLTRRYRPYGTDQSKVDWRLENIPVILMQMDFVLEILAKVPVTAGEVLTGLNRRTLSRMKCRSSLRLVVQSECVNVLMCPCAYDHECGWSRGSGGRWVV